MKKTSILLIPLLVSLLQAASAQSPNREDWKSLFNGKNLKGWHIQITGSAPGVNYKNTFQVKDKLLKVSYAEYEKFEGQFGHIYYKTPFSYYRLLIEYRFVGDQTPGGPDWARRNSGVMLHCQPPSSLKTDQEFPVSLEAQFLGGLGDGNPRSTANLCTPGSMVLMKNQLREEHCINSSSDTYHGDQWVQAELRVYGDSLIQHLVGGKVVMEYTKPVIGETGANRESFLNDWARANEGKPMTEGYIALQAESHPVEFRRVDLLNLQGCMNPKCRKYKAYYVKAGNCSCKGGSR